MRRNGPSALALPATVLVATLWLAVACGIAGTTRPTATVGAGAPPSSIATSLPTTMSAAPPDQAPAVEPTSTAEPTPAPPETTAPSAVAPETDASTPPAGWLSAGAQPVEGLLGTYCWSFGAQTLCADSPAFSERGPDLPDLAPGASGGQLGFELAGSYPFAGWGASYVSDNGDIVPLAEGNPSFDPDAAGPSVAPITEAHFPAPPGGEQWIVQVFIRFIDGGDAAYGWNVRVP